jgi:hypothetical protein
MKLIEQVRGVLAEGDKNDPSLALRAGRATKGNPRQWLTADRHRRFFRGRNRNG